MFNLFKRKHKNLPPFEKLESSDIKDKYFVRTMQWAWFNEKMIHVIDSNQPRMITMDPWPQQIYLDADGQKTIKEYVLSMAKMYAKNQIPNELDETILDVISNLIKDGGLIELKDSKTNLPENIKEPTLFGK